MKESALCWLIEIELKKKKWSSDARKKSKVTDLTLKGLAAILDSNGEI